MACIGCLAYTVIIYIYDFMLLPHLHFLIYDSLCRRLHPAMYLLALAYRTLDIEDARLRKRRMKDIVEDKMHRILSWCKTLVSGDVK